MQINTNVYNQYTSPSQFATKTNSSQPEEKTQKIPNDSPSPSHETKQRENQSGNKNPLSDSVVNKSKQAAQALNEVELKQIQDLKRRDTEVRAHEAAHLAAAGKHATGAASFDYKRGPDGKSYAVGGEVGIDTSPIPGDPQATLRKALQIQAAARAPANPSAQDRQVAAQASIMAVDARLEISQQKIEGETPSDAAKDKNNDDTSLDEDSKTQTNSHNAAANEQYQTVEGYTKDPITTIIYQVA